MDIGYCNEIDLSFYIEASSPENDANFGIVPQTLNYNDEGANSISTNSWTIGCDMQNEGGANSISANIKTIGSDIQNVIGEAFDKINTIPLDDFRHQICANKKTNNDQDIKILSVRRYALYNTAAIEKNGNIIVEHCDKLTANTSSIEHEHSRAVHAEQELSRVIDNIDIEMSDESIINFSKIKDCNDDWTFIMKAEPEFTSVCISSDIRLKKNVHTLTDSLKKINSMRGVEWNWKKNSNRTTGVIAQEILKIDPDLVNDSGGMMSVNYVALFGYVIEAFKEQTIIQKTQDDKINMLEKKLKTQKTEIDTIKAHMQLLLSKL